MLCYFIIIIVIIIIKVVCCFVSEKESMCMHACVYA